MTTTMRHVHASVKGGSGAGVGAGASGVDGAGEGRGDRPEDLVDAEVSDGVVDASARVTTATATTTDETPAAAADQLLVLMQKAFEDPVSFFQFVPELEQRLHVCTVAAAQDQGLDTSAELKRVKGHFDKLKFGFLHLETRKRFLAYLEHEAQLDASVSMLEPLHEQVERARRQIDQQHFSNSQVAQQLRSTVIALLQKWCSLEEHTRKFEESYDVPHAEQLRAQIHRLFPTTFADGLQPDSLHAQLQAVRDEQRDCVQRVRDVQRAAQHKAEQIKQLQQSIHEMQMQLQREEREEAVARAMPDASSVAQRHVDVVEAVAGVRVVGSSSSGAQGDPWMVVRVQPDPNVAEVAAQLKVHVSAENQRVVVASAVVDVRPESARIAVERVVQGVAGASASSSSASSITIDALARRVAEVLAGAACA